MTFDGKPGNAAARALVAVAIAAALVALTVGTAAAANQDTYFRVADEGIVQTKAAWWNPVADWFSQAPHEPTDGPRDVATLWDVFPLFEAADIVATARPSPARRAMVELIGRGAERYWNPEFKPVGGYWYRPVRRPNVNVFFDDNGWWALAFFDAFTATHDRRFLTDAIRAWRFIAVAGWATGEGGGIWWDTAHDRKTSEPLAAEILVGAELYRATHRRTYLRESLKLLAWANRHSWNRERRLYQRNETDPTVMDYVEGMMIGAHVTLCRALRRNSYCKRAEQLAAAALRAFPPSYHWAVETDAVYYRWLLTLYAVDRNRRWYRAADRWAQKALVNARDDRGLFTRRWDGTTADVRRLLTPGGTLMLLAAVAAAPRRR
ncbi:MAG TPA: glycoside hydrolase family 76 protein [Gaiellaceae bacterium]|nr:glycoside hydrolase family 76 protein [Gaiellaceae bacterium]